MCYFVKDGVVMGEYRPPDIPARDEGRVCRQIVVPSKYRSEILESVYSLPMSGNIGVNKTQDRILQHFY